MPIVDHKDDNKINNYYKNLQWVNAKKNLQKSNGIKVTSFNPISNLEYKEFESLSDACRYLKIKISNGQKIVKACNDESIFFNLKWKLSEKN